MKQIKKLASLLLAAVLAMTLLAGCGGRGGNVSTAVTEQSLLKYINEARASVDQGLSPVKNDSKLANAAAKLLEEFEKQTVETDYGDGYKMSKSRATEILKEVTGKNDHVALSTGDYSEAKVFFRVTPISSQIGASMPDSDFYLLRRANRFSDTYVGFGMSSNPARDFISSGDINIKNIKVGIAFREIKGERFALVVYDVTKQAS